MQLCRVAFFYFIDANPCFHELKFCFFHCGLLQGSSWPLRLFSLVFSYIYNWWTNSVLKVLVTSVVSNSLWLHGLWPARLLCLWNSLGKNTGMSSHTNSGMISVPLFWSSDAQRQLTGLVPDPGKDWGQKEKRASENEMAGRHHWFNGHELGQTSGDDEGQGGLLCCSPWGCKELDTTGRLNNKALKSVQTWWIHLFRK